MPTRGTCCTRAVYDGRMKFIASGVVVLLIGCGGGGGSSPEEKCDDLIDLVCDRVVECVPDEVTRSQCISELRSALPCGMADRVSSTYDRCMDLLEDLTCSALFPNDELVVPADCENVILAERVSNGESVLDPRTSAVTTSFTTAP